MTRTTTTGSEPTSRNAACQSRMETTISGSNDGGGAGEGGSYAAGAAVYEGFTKEVLDQQEATKQGLEQRGVVVITSCGTIATLLFGLVAFVTAQKSYDISRWAGGFLYIAIVLFAAAAVTAILTNAPQKYAGVDADGLDRFVKTRSSDDEYKARRAVGITRVHMIKVAKKQNQVKSQRLAMAIGLEVVATVALSVSAVLVLANK
jgi:hypothetical protein